MDLLTPAPEEGSIVIILGLVLILLAAGLGVLLYGAAANSSTQTVELESLGFAITMSPEALLIAGAAMVVLLWFGWQMLTSSIRRSTRHRREERQRLAEEEHLARDRKTQERLEEQRQATEIARQRAEVAEERLGTHDSPPYGSGTPRRDPQTPGGRGGATGSDYRGGSGTDYRGGSGSGTDYRGGSSVSDHRPGSDYRGAAESRNADYSGSTSTFRASGSDPQSSPDWRSSADYRPGSEVDHPRGVDHQRRPSYRETVFRHFDPRSSGS